MKLKESIPSNSVKIIDLYNKIDSEILDTSPDFQRKLVWKKQHKFAFIETILLNYPFPEVYIASAEMDIDNLRSKEIVVDGKQRLTAIKDYIKGINDFENQKKVIPFAKLSSEEKKDFLNYLVTVKDLKDMDMAKIKEVFQRINSTEYSLNTIEKTNAQYGDGEFAVFCKQIVDSEYNPTENTTDIILDKPLKDEFNNFFIGNNIFNDHDKARMFDVQYIMLLTSTILEGDYYGRSSKVNEYLEKYNTSFENFEVPLGLLAKSIQTIKGLKFDSNSYWYNKANLFTLIIELSKTDVNALDLDKLEKSLLELETKVDYYFSDDVTIEISEEEKRYFEFARQGSHEKAARLHRGKVISDILHNSRTDNKNKDRNSAEQRRLEILASNNINYVTIEPTKTGLEKSIMDATSSVREFLKSNQIHNYDTQQNGTEHKVIKEAIYIQDITTGNSDVSLYRANHRGDSRIWFTNLKLFASANDVIAIVYKNNNLYLINITKLDLENLLGGDNPFNNIIIS